MNVLYFTASLLTEATGGGTLCSRNHIERLAEDSKISLYAVIACPPAAVKHHRSHLTDRNVKHQILTMNSFVAKPPGTSAIDLIRYAAAMLLETPWDVPAMHQGHIESAISYLIEALQIDILVVEYTPSALYLRMPRTDVRTLLIKTNREADFYSEMVRRGMTHHGRWTAKLSVSRWRRVERNLERSFDQIVTIGEPDLPRYQTKRLPVCITPYLNRSEGSWVGGSSNNLLFVGNIHHWPNRDAVQWIAVDLAPELEQVRPDLRIVVVGASAEDVPEEWRVRNVRYEGTSDPQALDALFQNCGALLCPVDNTFGVKFKAAEAIACGMPLIASAETLLGFPYLDKEPILDLKYAYKSAMMLSDIVNEKALQQISARQKRQHQAFVDSQTGVWSSVLERM